MSRNLKLIQVAALAVVAAGCSSEASAPEASDSSGAAQTESKGPAADSGTKTLAAKDSMTAAAGSGSSTAASSGPTMSAPKANASTETGGARASATGPAGAGASAAGAAGASASASAAGASASGPAGAAAAGMMASTAAGSGSVQPPPNRTPLTSLMYPTTTEKVDEAPTFNIIRPMDLKVGETARPVVVWANGGCFRSDFTWSPLFERWASAGFVVLALTGTGGDNDIAGMLGMTTKTEHGALIDWVEKANASGPYAGALDLSRIVAAGNSCGGVTALELTAEDKRVAAVFVLSGSSAVGSVNKAVMEAISVPVGYITGNPSEDVAAPNASDDYDAMKDGLPALLVQRKMGDHLTVSTDEKILPEDAEIALNWMDLALYGTREAHDMLTSAKVCEHCTPDTWTIKAKNLETLIK